MVVSWDLTIFNQQRKVILNGISGILLGKFSAFFQQMLKSIFFFLLGLWWIFGGTRAGDTPNDLWADEPPSIGRDFPTVHGLSRDSCSCFFLRRWSIVLWLGYPETDGPQPGLHCALMISLVEWACPEFRRACWGFAGLHLEFYDVCCTLKHVSTYVRVYVPRHFLGCIDNHF